MCDIYAPVRAGSDIAFLGGIINYILEHDLWFKEYALAYTNLPTIIDERFRDTSELDGVFSGFDEESRSYKYDSWQYQGEIVPSTLAEHYVNTTESFAEKLKRIENGPPQNDYTLTHPFCVYQILKRHYAAYTPEMVERTTGCPREVFLKVAEAVARNSGRERTGAICYAVGWTHHTTGVQMIRAAAILQGLLGNVGRPGGGILALRGHTSIQGSTDIPTLVQHAADLSAAAARLQAAQDGRRLPQERNQPDWLVAQFPEIRRQPVEGVLRRARDEGQWLGLSLAAAHRRRPFAIADELGDPRRRDPRHARHRPEPGGRRAQCAHGAARTGRTRLARRARHRRERNRLVLVQGTAGAGRRTRPRKTSPPKCF